VRWRQGNLAVAADPTGRPQPGGRSTFAAHGDSIGEEKENIAVEDFNQSWRLYKVPKIR
jgi:hypothetical protein